MTGPDPSRPVDEATLRYLSRAFGRRSEVRRTSLFPSTKPESLVVPLDTEHYPENVDIVSLELRACTTGDFHVSYREVHAGDRRRCRWDRHDQPHSARDHFHPIPDAAAVVDRSYATDLTRVIEGTVLPWVDERVGVLWESTTD